MSTQTPVAELHETDDRRPPSPFEAVARLWRPVVSFVWTEKRGLALTALLYALGLVVWSLNTSRRELGLGVAADLQYLIAGLVPALVLAAALALLVAWLRVPAWARDRLRTRWPEVTERVSAIGGIMFLAGALGLGALAVTGLLDRAPVLEAVPLVALFAGTVLVGLTGEGTFLFRLIWYVYGPLAVVLVLALAVAFYADWAYPRLPQSLGGGKPRCAQLDVDTSSLSQTTLAELAPAAARTDVVRTQRLDIVFAQGGTLYVQRPADDRVLELRGDAIRAVIGCG